VPSSHSPLRVTIFTALPTETDAVLEQLESFTPQLVGDTVSQTGALKGSVSGCQVTVVELGPGNIETAMEAGRVRSDGSADILLFVGIAGALKDLALGDVVAAHEVVWLHRAKIEGGERWNRGQMHPCSRELVQVARYTADHMAWQQRLAQTTEGPQPRAVVGQILSGEELVKDPAYRQELTHRFSDALAVENEGYGLVRAATAALKVLVIRGASDHADATKSDRSQPAAARAAAAFAAELLNDYLRLIESPLPEGSGHSATTPANTSSDAGLAADIGATTTAYDRAATTIETLRNDIDLVVDDDAAVVEFARADFDAADAAMRVALVELLASDIDDEVDDLVTRRLRAYGRTFVSHMTEAGLTVEWDTLLKRAPAGAAVLLAQPDVFADLGARERRRVLSGFLGNAESRRSVTVLGWRHLLMLTRSEVLTAEESGRVREAQYAASYAALSEAGMTVDELMPKLREDLGSRDYNAQNRAAGHLTALGPSLNTHDLTDDAEGELASLLVIAADEGAYGAKDATSRSRMAEWSVPALVRALWTSLTRGRDRLDSPLQAVPDVLAAATMAGKLADVCDAITGENLPAHVTPMREDDIRYERDWLLKRGEHLPSEARRQWEQFVDAVVAAVPRRS